MFRRLLLLNYFLVALVGLMVLVAPGAIAETDDVGVQLEVTDSTSGGGGSGGGPIIPPTSAAVPNVSNFLAIYYEAQARVALTWSKPDISDLEAVRVVRQLGFLPTAPDDGLLIYDGAGEAAFDSDVSAGATYFYAAFVRDASGRYSSGAVAAVLVPANELPSEDIGEEPPPDDELSPGEPPSGEVGESPADSDQSTDPFRFFPQVIDDDPLIRRLDLGDFIFFQPGERQKFFRGGEAVPVTAGKDLSVSVNYERLPESLKTIGLTLVDPSDAKRSASFILRINQDKTSYTANLGTLFKTGIYPLYISIVNFENQTIKRLFGQLVVEGPGDGAASLTTITNQITQPLVLAFGLGAGLVQALSLAGQINSFSDLYLFFWHFWSFLLRTLGLRRRFQPWGVVYDSITKRPLDPAYVVVQRSGEEAATAITDLDGRYGFLVPPATYTLLANKTHYKFPSSKLRGRRRDELYENLYFGEPFTTSSGEVINRNIPLDPVAFDWNEFAKEQQGFFMLHSRRERRRRLIYNTVFGLGAVLALSRLLFAPSIVGIVISFLYLVMFVLKYIWRARRPTVTVRRAATGQPVPFAVVRAFVPDVNQQVKSVVADALGRFFLLTPPGEYYLTVEEKLPDETYRKIYQSPPQKLDRGVLTKDLVV